MAFKIKTLVRITKWCGITALAAVFGTWVWSEINIDTLSCPLPSELAGDMTLDDLPSFSVLDTTTGIDIVYRYGRADFFEPSLRRDAIPLPEGVVGCQQGCSWTPDVGLRYSLYGGAINMLGATHASTPPERVGRGDFLTTSEAFYYNSYDGGENVSYVVARDPQVIGVPVGEGTRVLVSERVMSILNDCRGGV